MRAGRSHSPQLRKTRGGQDGGSKFWLLNGRTPEIRQQLTSNNADAARTFMRHTAASLFPVNARAGEAGALAVSYPGRDSPR